VDLDGDRNQFLRGLGTVDLITDLSRSDAIELAKNLIWVDKLPFVSFEKRSVLFSKPVCDQTDHSPQLH
jgi:hypothetical protein